VQRQLHAGLYEFFDSAHRNFPLQKFTEASRIYRSDPRGVFSADVSTNHKASKGHANFERPALTHATNPAGPLTSTHRIFGFIRQGVSVGMRSAEVTDIAWAVFAVVFISALLIAFVSLR
jgi:hypothetical protein